MNKQGKAERWITIHMYMYTGVNTYVCIIKKGGTARCRLNE